MHTTPLGFLFGAEGTQILMPGKHFTRGLSPWPTCLSSALSSAFFFYVAEKMGILLPLCFYGFCDLFLIPNVWAFSTPTPNSSTLQMPNSVKQFKEILQPLRVSVTAHTTLPLRTHTSHKAQASSASDQKLP